MQEYEDLKVLVAEIEADINKAEGGNKAAGTRVRKQMQAIKQAGAATGNTYRRTTKNAGRILQGPACPVKVTTTAKGQVRTKVNGTGFLAEGPPRVRYR